MNYCCRSKSFPGRWGHVREAQLATPRSPLFPFVWSYDSIPHTEIIVRQNGLRISLSCACQRRRRAS